MDTMRRSGNLIEAVAELDNLKLAYTKACKAKPLSRDSLEFRCNLDTRLIELGDALRSGTYVPGPYRFFTIYDPRMLPPKAGRTSARTSPSSRLQTGPRDPSLLSTRPLMGYG